MSFLRKSAHVLAMLACLGLSAWTIGCGQPASTDTDTTTPATNGTPADGGMDAPEAGSGTGDGAGAGIEVPPMPEDGATETE